MSGLVALLMIASVMSDDLGLPADAIPAYRDALAGRGGAPGADVSFRDLWEAPERHRGQRVTFTGRIVRRFQAGPSGELPARQELWLEAGGNLVCLVVPDSRDARARNGVVRGSGTSLGLTRYQSGDVIRLAPLIVGSAPPESAPEAAPAYRGTWDGASWVVGAFACLALVGFFLLAYGRRPRPRRLEGDPPVEFLS